MSSTIQGVVARRGRELVMALLVLVMVSRAMTVNAIRAGTACNNGRDAQCEPWREPHAGGVRVRGGGAPLA